MGFTWALVEALQSGSGGEAVLLPHALSRLFWGRKERQSRALESWAGVQREEAGLGSLWQSSSGVVG